MLPRLINIISLLWPMSKKTVDRVGETAWERVDRAKRDLKKAKTFTDIIENRIANVVETSSSSSSFACQVKARRHPTAKVGQSEREAGAGGCLPHASAGARLHSIFALSLTYCLGGRKKPTKHKSSPLTHTQQSVTSHMDAAPACPELGGGRGQEQWRQDVAAPNCTESLSRLATVCVPSHPAILE